MTDTAEITIKAGNGGHGIVSFRREKYIPRGGPWGGDGGHGGDIYFYVDPNLNTLSAFKRQRKYEAEKGMPGMKNRKQGKSGEDLTIKVPAGTVVRDSENKILYDLTVPKEKILIQKGGHGGLGNWHFKSSVNQTPMKATDGKQTELIELKLELRLIADAGIIGLPSSGKSTLLNSLAKTEVKTAEYHFTTLEPNIGVVRTSEILGEGYEDIVLADLPGIIEGASEGKGLGHDFLRHVERTKVLVHLLDGNAAALISPSELIKQYKVIQNELKKWDEEIIKIDPSISKLSEKRQVVAVNKIDITEVREMQKDISAKFKKTLKIEPLFVSAATSEGTKELLKRIVEIIASHEDEAARIPKPIEEETTKFDISNLPNKRIVFKG
jgi:GTP-binding protein